MIQHDFLAALEARLQARGVPLERSELCKPGWPACGPTSPRIRAYIAERGNLWRRDG
jgi:hypothetical protein